MIPRHMLGIALALPASLIAQTHAPTYPSPPRSLGDSTEIALAMTAAPAEVSANADVYVLRGTKFEKAKSGTNGCACLVGRDLHEGSRYPICFDQEGSKTTLFRELMEGSLRAQGMSEADVKKAVEVAYAKGDLRMPATPAMAYMMSPSQVLFSSPNADGRRVGAWAPHLMLMLPGVVEPAHFGLARDSKVDIIQIDRRGTAHSELVVKVAKWSDGSVVK